LDGIPAYADFDQFGSLTAINSRARHCRIGDAVGFWQAIRTGESPSAPVETQDFTPQRTAEYNSAPLHSAQRWFIPSIPVEEKRISRSGSRIPSLDGLRALSIGAVLVGHVADTQGTPAAFGMLAHSGYLGVRMFFVISGYLITSLLLREKAAQGGISLRDFYIRRTIRIWPAFYTYVCAIVLLAALGFLQIQKHDVAYAATFTMNYHGDRSWVLNHTWSLAVEEQFYLLWPLGLMALSRAAAGRIVVGVLIFVPLVRALMWYVFGASDTAMTREFQAVSDALAAGACLAIFSDRLPRIRVYGAFVKSPLSAAIGVVLIGVSSYSFKVSPAVFYVWMQSLTNLGMILLLEHALAARDGIIFKFLNLRMVAYMGVISYSLYLWQELFLDPTSWSWYARFPQNLILTLGASLLSYYFIEKPFLRLGRSFRHRS
jgi:peptidoglycan/LPS O-acetylase OafA/YrhL